MLSSMGWRSTGRGSNERIARRLWIASITSMKPAFPLIPVAKFVARAIGLADLNPAFAVLLAQHRVLLAGLMGDLAGELLVAAPASAIEFLRLQGGLHRATGFVGMAAIGEATGGRQGLDVLARRRDPLGGVAEGQFAHAGGVQQQAAAWKQDQFAMRGGVAAPPVVLACPGGGHASGGPQDASRRGPARPGTGDPRPRGARARAR